MSKQSIRITTLWPTVPAPQNCLLSIEPLLYRYVFLATYYKDKAIRLTEAVTIMWHTASLMRWLRLC